MLEIARVAGRGGVSGTLGLARSVKAPLGLVLLLGSLMIFGPVSIDMYLPALPAIGRGLGAAPAAVQQTVTAFFLGIAVGQLIYGPLSDRLGRRGPLLTGIGFYVAASLGCAFAPSIGALIALRLAQAFGGCAGMVMARAVVRDRFEHDEMLHVLSLLLMVMGVAPILAPLIGGWMLLVADWRWIFGLQAAFGAMVGVAVLGRLSESRPEATRLRARSETPFRSYFALLSQPRLVGYVLSSAFAGATLFTYIATSPDVVIRQFHISPQMFGWVFGLNAFGLIGGTQINARLARRVPSDVILRRASLTTLGAGGFLLVTAHTGWGGVWGVLGPLFLVMASLGFTQANAQAGAMGVDSSRSGATAALLGAGSFGAGAAASAVAGLLRDGTARPMALVIFGSLALSALSLRVLVKPR